MPANHEPSSASASSAEGLVCSIHGLASAAGTETMRAGGNAVDAAIAANAVLAVIAPYACGMGGDLFALVQEGDGAPDCLNASGRAPSGASAQQLVDEGHTEVPKLHHPAAVTIPGCVDGWLSLHERYGSVPLGDILAPAIDLAVNGFPASETLAAAAETVANIAGNTDIPAGLQPGQTVRRAGSGRALKAIATDGREGFYTGEFGEGLLELKGGWFQPQDLQRPQSEWVEPISAEAWEHRLWTAPPNSQGYLILAAATIAQSLELPNDPEHPDWAHCLIEAARAAGASRPAELSDRAAAATLLDAAHLETLARGIRNGQHGKRVHPAQPGDTTYLCAADKRWVVSLIQSNAQGFGSLLVAGSTGIFLHNRALGFNLNPAHDACLRPGRRPPHTLAPVLITDQNGRRRGAAGTMGGDAQPQIVLQLLARHLHCGQSPRKAVTAGRWILLGKTAFSTWTNDRHPDTALEAHTPPAWREGLRNRGHTVRELQEPPLAGHAHILSVTPKGKLKGASDPRVTTATVSTI